MNEKEFVTRAKSRLTQEEELWYVIEWDEEDGISLINHKKIVGDNQPAELEHVHAKLLVGTTWKTFGGVVLKKGSKWETDKYIDDQDLSEVDSSGDEYESPPAKKSKAKEAVTKGKASAFSLSDNSDDEVEVPPYNPPPAKAKKTNSSVDLELKEARKTTSKCRAEKKSAKEAAQRELQESILQTVVGFEDVLTSTPRDSPGSASHQDCHALIMEMREDIEELKKAVDGILKKEAKKQEKRSRHEKKGRRSLEYGAPLNCVTAPLNCVTSSPASVDGNGVLLGDPSSGGICIPGISPKLVRHAENISQLPSKLAVNLLTALFTQEEIATGNCTKPSRSDINLLDPEKVAGIKAHIQFKYPLSSKMEEDQRWKTILKNNLNAKCRGSRKKLTLCID